MTTDSRAEALREWLVQQYPHAPGPLTPITGDASFRRYFRVEAGDAPRIAMDAPPEHEAVEPFVSIARRLEAAGVQAPHVFAVDESRGFVLMSDLGDGLYLDALGEQSADALYGDALDALVRMQARVSTEGLPPYDRERLHAEMALFPTWLLGEHLGIDTDAEPVAGALVRTSEALADAALEQPRVFVHRDYHSRNLMVTDRDNPGVLDFQDAVAGPLTYDLVSLLRDCYVAWDDARIDRWIERYRRRAAEAGIDLPEPATLRRWFDLMGAQRHLKAAGIFARLWHRDGKPRYLADIPRTWGYIERLFGHYPELAPLAELARRLDLPARIAELRASA